MIGDLEVVHPLPASELEPWLASMLTNFLGNSENAAVEAPIRAKSWDPSRSYGIRDRGRWVATLRTLDRRITLPLTDDDITVDALTSVTVSATHRRRGLLRTMLNQSLEEAKERGDAIAALIAAEWPIYGRFGYAPSSDVANYTVHTREPGAHLLRPASGEVYQVDVDQFAVIAPQVFAAVQPQRAGNIDRPGYWWARALGLDGAPREEKNAPVFLVHEGADGIDGYVTWTSTGHWSMTGPLGQITVNDLMATTDEAYTGLWQYLLGMDVIDAIHLTDRPVDEPLPSLLADGRAILQTSRIDRLWLRLLDVPAAMAARRYSVDGALVVEVDDPDGRGYARGRYQLDGGPDGAACAPTTRPADLRLHQRALASSYLGGVSLRSQQISGLVDELTPGALLRADAMLASPLAPWCATSF